MLLSRIKSYYEKEYVRLEKELRQMPEGRLCIREKDGKVYYYQRIGKSQKGITRNEAIVYSLARKEYLEREVAKIGRLNKTLAQICDIEEDEKQVQEASIIGVPKGLDASRVKFSDAQLEWAKGVQSQNDYNEHEKKYMTSSGLKVRSKSERYIAEYLEQRGILFKYEPAICFGEVTLYPDFLILFNDGRVVIWEHFGLFDNEEYRAKAFRKIETYRKNGFVQHKNLICTFEEDLLDVNTLDEILERFMY